FEYARSNGCPRVTIVHKAYIMKRTYGMFLCAPSPVGEQIPYVLFDDVIVDGLCMELMLPPERFDVLVCGNLFGEMVAVVAAGISGGPGDRPSVNLNEDGVHVFGAPHGDPPALVGTDRGNPLTVLFPTV